MPDSKPLKSVTTDLLDEEAVEELILIFPEEADRLMMLETSLGDMNASLTGLEENLKLDGADSTIEGCLHKLKGSAGNLGMKALESYVKDLYHRMRSGQRAPNAEEIKHIAFLFRLSLQAATKAGLFPQQHS
jgi:HPt (histidine-containing phosphotransfer) domain-containing protein